MALKWLQEPKCWKVRLGLHSKTVEVQVFSASEHANKAPKFAKTYKKPSEIIQK